MRLDTEEPEEAEVALSPLIDCVFLLLIFFLVTTMLKKFQRQIPIELPESAAVPAESTQYEEVIIRMDAEGAFSVAHTRDREGRWTYRPIDSLPLFLRDLKAERGVDAPLRLDADRDLEMQTVIDALDVCQIQGFERTFVRLQHADETYFQIPGKSLRPDLP
ncbi:MAG: ExbD/TolR family protein [Opitutales bacterium]